MKVQEVYRRAAALVFVVTLTSLASAAPPSTPDIVAIERAVVDAVNAARTERGLQPLTVDPELTGIARRHSCAMAERGFFEHTMPDGTTMAERLKAAGRRYLAAGENLARIEARDPAARAVAGWLKSATHRENMLSPRFTTTGVGACRGGRAVYLTQLFLRPR
jgi:uncharacterized protein YkwD